MRSAGRAVTASCSRRYARLTSVVETTARMSATAVVVSIDCSVAYDV
jgi:hypothetical protein